MKFRKITIIFVLLAALQVMGCSQKLSTVFSESWSENFALAMYGTDASNPRINDGNIDTWGVSEPPKREYTLTFPEERNINRIVVYSQNVTSYKLLAWNAESRSWEVISALDSTDRKQRVYSDKYKISIPRFDHRLKVRTSKIKLETTRTSADGVTMTPNPGKDDLILNHQIDYVGTGRRRRRVDLYEIYVKSPAAIREIEAYSFVEKPETGQ